MLTFTFWLLMFFIISYVVFFTVMPFFGFFGAVFGKK